jgi:hypothetical protein
MKGGFVETCDQCGNAYAQTFQVHMKGKDYSFDCFECAIAKLAPHCNECDTRVIGHGVEYNSDIYCCAQCARNKGIEELQDHA